MEPLLDMTRALIALLFLFYASWSDHKTREVSNTVWVLFAPSAFTLTFLEICFFESSWLSTLSSYALSFGLTAVFSLILFYSGAFGGADAKALMCIALALPFYPSDLPFTHSTEISPISQMFFPLTVFSNSVLLAAGTAVYILLRNILWHRRTGRSLFEGDHKNESFGKKALVLVTGYKVPLDRLKEKWHWYPLEDITQGTETGFKRKLIVLPKDEGRNAIVERLEKAIREGLIQDGVWATPGLPMLIFVTAGLIVGLIFGDVIWFCLRFVLR